MALFLDWAVTLTLSIKCTTHISLNENEYRVQNNTQCTYKIHKYNIYIIYILYIYNIGEIFASSFQCRQIL